MTASSAKIAEVICPAQGSGRVRGALVPVVDSSIAAVGDAGVRVDDVCLQPPAAPARACRAAVDEVAATVWTATGLERQVFLDHTGRRGRRVRVAGAGMAVLSAGWLAALVTGSIGFSSLPSLPPATGRFASRPPPAARVVHLAATHHVRRRVVETAALSPPGPAAAAARTETAGAIR